MTQTFYPETSGGGVAIYATLSDFPASASDGTLAVAADTSFLYVYDTISGWQVVASPGGGIALSSGKILIGNGSNIAAAFTGLSGILGNDGTPTSSSGFVGYFVDVFAGPVAVTTGAFATVASTGNLPVGTYEVAGYIYTDNGVGYTGGDFRLNIKGANPGFGNNNYAISQPGPASGACFPPTTVKVVSGDADKTVKMEGVARGVTQDMYARVYARVIS